MRLIDTEQQENIKKKQWDSYNHCVRFLQFYILEYREKGRRNRNEGRAVSVQWVCLFWSANNLRAIFMRVLFSLVCIVCCPAEDIRKESYCYFAPWNFELSLPRNDGGGTFLGSLGRVWTPIHPCVIWFLVLATKNERSHQKNGSWPGWQKQLLLFSLFFFCKYHFPFYVFADNFLPLKLISCEGSNSVCPWPITSTRITILKVIFTTLITEKVN